MESLKVLFEIDKEDLELESDLETVYFTKPCLIGYYEKKHDILEPAKKIYYFRNPTSEDYPINLNTHKSKFTCVDVLQPKLRYAMSSPIFEKNDKNRNKIKIFTSEWCLNRVMSSYYHEIREPQTIRVSRYNSDLYILFGDEEYYSELEYDKEWQQLLERCYELRNNLFTGKFVINI